MSLETDFDITTKCHRCNGTGIGTPDGACPSCSGAGFVTTSVIRSSDAIDKILHRLKKIMDKLEIGDD
jgi:DnaJ-class molecular chaperone